LQTPGSDAVSKQMSDKLQFVARPDKLKHVGHQTASLPKRSKIVLDNGWDGSEDASTDESLFENSL